MVQSAGAPAATAPGATGKRPPRRGAFAAWQPTSLIFLAPALLLLTVFLIYPVFWTFYLSLHSGLGFSIDRLNFVGLGNYVTLLTSDRAFLSWTIPPSGALVNNMLWLVIFVPACIFFGLIIAVIAARVRYEAIVKAIVFLPMAVAATALGVIWMLMYSTNTNVGVLNALIGLVGVSPIPFLGRPDTVNFALIAVGIWGSVGFAAVILSAALKGISTEILEAARVDGATENQIFWRIIVPMLSLPISVVAVFLVISVIKLFDLIFVMTAGGPGTASRVIAFTMYQEGIPLARGGYAAAVAVMMLIILLPVIVFNIRRFRTEAVT
jgi:alpha-glucoside transport system permease protein